jgi:hypothetical protein
MSLHLPADSWVLKTHCFTNAGYPDDGKDLHEVDCGTDIAWSIFDTPRVTATQSEVTVVSTFRNRSSNRNRLAKLTVDWQVINAATPQITPLDFDVFSTSPHDVVVSRELVDQIVWSVGHQGCRIYDKDSWKSIQDLQRCYATNQKNPFGGSLIKGASQSEIAEGTRLAAPRVREEYRVKDNFDWVMNHEQQHDRFSELLAAGDFEQIRKVYQEYQDHNPMARNVLGAVSNAEIAVLVEGQTVGSSAELSHVPASLIDNIQWSIVQDGCVVFHGESLDNASALKQCFARTMSANHNGEYLSQVFSASKESVSAATERAVTKTKEDFAVDNALNRFLVNSGELANYQTWSRDHNFERVRSDYIKQSATAGRPPYLLNVLADSEIAAVVNRFRLDVVIPAHASADSLRSIAKLVDSHITPVTQSTTTDALAAGVCGESGSNYAESFAHTSCLQLVRDAARSQGFSISASGNLLGAKKIDLPTLPRAGVPSLVTFRAGVSPNTVTTVLSSGGAKFARPSVATLIMPERGAHLANDTIKKYGNNGLQWFSAAIAADRIKPSDLRLTTLSRVGVVDAGVDIHHTKLKAFFWKLPVTLPNVPWERGSIGYDYVSETADPSEFSSPGVDGSLESHGTHITGLVTARGLAEWIPEIASLGLERFIQVYSLKIATGTNGMIPDFTLPGQALHDGLANDIHLFNLSLEGPRVPMIREDIVKHAASALLVVAAGNDGLDLNKPENLHVNGSFRTDDGKPLENVLFVAALMDVGALTPNSNHGDVAVQIAAPGNNIWSTVQGGGFDAITGTSQAAPLVTSTAAILSAERVAYPAEIKDRILATCDWDEKLSRAKLIAEGCRLNMAKAVVTGTDLVELVAKNSESQPIWLRGDVDRMRLEVTDAAGDAIDTTGLERMLLINTSGSVRVAMKAAGHLSGHLKSKSIFLKLRAGEICPNAMTGPCELHAVEVRDVVFGW